MGRRECHEEGVFPQEEKGRAAKGWGDNIEVSEGNRRGGEHKRGGSLKQGKLLTSPTAQRVLGKQAILFTKVL